MWLHPNELRRAGFRRHSPRYWRCAGRHGLPAHAHLSAFAHAVSARGGSERVDVAAFHVTFVLGADSLHFYYHDAAEGAWEPGGHTSTAELLRYPVDPARLRADADAVAARLAAALATRLLPRG